MHLVHLVCGSTGAGKTTYARELSERIGGVRFSIDEWMSTLFWMDTPQPLEVAWSMQRLERCLEQIWAVAKQVAARRIPCVLDVGFGQASARHRFYKLSGDAGLSVQLHVLDVSSAERWRRIETRNREKGATYNLPFDVTREMFDLVETLWEAPTNEEMASSHGIRIST
jgi:predicted kinase